MSFTKTADCLKRFSNNLATPDTGILVETSGSDTELEVSVSLKGTEVPVLLIGLNEERVRVIKLPSIQKEENYVEGPYRDQYQLMSFILPHLYSVYEGYSVPDFISLLLNEKIEGWKDFVEFLQPESESDGLYDMKVLGSKIYVDNKRKKVTVESVSDMEFEYSNSLELIQILLEVLSYLCLVQGIEPEVFDVVVVEAQDEEVEDSESDTFEDNSMDFDIDIDNEEPVLPEDMPEEEEISEAETEGVTDESDTVD